MLNRMSNRLAAMALLSGTLLVAGPADAAAQPHYARSFELLECDAVTTLTVIDAWPGAGAIDYALIERGHPAPVGGTYDAVVAVPVQRAVVLDSPAIAAFVDLGMSSAIRAVGSRETVYDEGLRRAIDRGIVAEVGYGPAIDIEQVLALRPDVIVASALSADDPVRELGARAGVPVVVWADWREAHPLGRAEWIRVAAALVGRGRSAAGRFARRVDHYEALATRLGGIDEAARPKVLLNAPWRGAWAMPAGGSYMARLIRDAGGRYPWQETPGSGSITLDIETVLARAADSDVWLNGNSDWISRGDILNTDARLTAFQPYRIGAVYHYDRRRHADGANDFWERGVLRPDLVLADVVAILHPDAITDHEFTFYRRLP